jgi:lysophospholipase L1-like esterase
MKLIWIIVGLILLYLIVSVSLMVHKISIGRKLSDIAEPFERQGEGKKVLFLGDSTAAGVGSEKGGVPYWFSEEYPNLDIKNLGVSGNRLKNVVEDKYSGEYDLIMIQAGGNDIFQISSYSDIESNLRKVLSKAKKSSDNVIVLHTGKVGTAPFFAKWLGLYMTHRAKKVRDIYLKVSSEEGAHYVDLFLAEDPFHSDIDKYYATDYLHLSDSGYQVWFNEIRKVMDKNGIKLN